MNFPADDNDVDDILVLYALEHDVALVGQSWIDYFFDGLRSSLKSQSDSNTYQVILRNEEMLSNWSDDNKKSIYNAKAIVVVISPFYLQKPIYQPEFVFIQKNIDILAQRLFLVEWTEVPIPKILRYPNNYRLWMLDDNMKPYTLGLPTSKIDIKEDIDEKKYFWHKIQDLAYDIQKLLPQKNHLKSQTSLKKEIHNFQNLKDSSENQLSQDVNSENLSENKCHYTVFLAEVTDDLYMLREEIQNHLEQEHICVLPKDSYLFRESDSLNSMIKEDLQKCDLFVQLFSETIPHPTIMAMLLKQLRCAKEIFTASQMLVWRDFKLASEESLGTPVDELCEETNDIVSIVEIENFKTNILKQLKRIKEEKETQKNKSNVDGTTFFFYAFPEDEDFADELGDYAVRNFQILSSFPITDPDPQKILDDIKNNLLYCNIALLIYKESPVTWVRQNILFLNKTIPEIERKKIPKPFVIICQINDNALKMKLPSHFEVVDFTNQSPQHIIQHIVKIVESLL